MENINKVFKEFIERSNNQGIDDFEGLSPVQMNNILYNSFEKDSIIRINPNADDSVLNQIGFSMLTEYFLNLIQKQKELKLTNNGYLPVKIVEELYNTKFILEDLIESGFNKLSKEMDSMIITLLKIISDLANFTKIRKNKLSLTKKGHRILKKKRSDLLAVIFKTFCYKYNWAYFDGYGDNQTGQIGFGFTIFLLSKYGNRFYKSNFYAEKYLNAFPAVIDQFVTTDYLDNSLMRIHECYSLRTFERFLKYFNLIEMTKNSSKFNAISKVKKSEIFDKVITVTPC